MVRKWLIVREGMASPRRSKNICFRSNEPERRAVNSNSPCSTVNSSLGLFLRLRFRGSTGVCVDTRHSSAIRGVYTFLLICNVGRRTLGIATTNVAHILYRSSSRIESDVAAYSKGTPPSSPGHRFAGDCARCTQVLAMPRCRVSAQPG